MQPAPSPSEANEASPNWLTAASTALPICLFILARFYYWFAIADRYAIFLYNHLHATPFDPITRSRYWMAGLVAAGEVMIFYGLANWVAGRIAPWVNRSYAPPPWHLVWALCAPVLAVGILVITMTVNSPTLPLPLALASAGATLAGLALALMPGALTARHPCDLIWLACDGAGLVPTLLLLRVVELPSMGLSLPFTPNMVYPIAAGAIVASIIGLGIMTGLRIGRRKPAPSAGAVLVAGLALTYLLLPVAHHWLATPPDWRYISTSSNFFAINPLVQAAAVLAAAAMAFGVTRLRRALGIGIDRESR